MNKKRIILGVANVITYIHKRLAVISFVSIVVAIIGAGVAAKEIYGTALQLPSANGPGFKRVTGIADSATSTGSPFDFLVTEYYLRSVLEGLQLGSGNKMEVYNVRDYGATGTASIPVSGNNVTGTNDLNAFKAAINAAPAGAIVFVGSGSFRVEGGITITTKKIIFINLGKIYTNGTDFFIFGAPGGSDRHHIVINYGEIWARVNIPTNSTTTRANGTSPQWNTFTGSCFKLLPNVNNMYIKTNVIGGFLRGVEIQGGGGGGCQENTVAFIRMEYNSNAFVLRNTTGDGWMDKNIFTGWDGGTGRVTGGLAILIDGFSGAAPSNGETFNGAARSNKFKIMAERLDSVIRANADCTDMELDLTIEAGDFTGVFGQSNVIQLRSVLPNLVRSPRIHGTGILNTPWLTSGLGINGILEHAVWLNNSTFIGMRGIIDPSGTLVMEVEPNLSLTTRNALPANIKCINRRIVPVTRQLNQASYTIVAADAEGTIVSNYISGSPAVITFSTPGNFVNVGVYVKNDHASNNVTLSGVSNKTVLAPGESVYVRCNGTTFRSLSGTD